MAKGVDYFGYDNPFIRFKTFFSCRAREKMYRLFEEALLPQPTDEVLDLGATPDSTLADSNFFEKRYPYKNKITVASIENCSSLVKEYGLKKFVYNEPKQKLPFGDLDFQILFCSAVLEHVGSREDQLFFLKECLRVSKKVFITTPNRYFPLEMHTFIPFLHWLPWQLFQKICKVIKGGFWADINNLNLLSRKDIIAMLSPLEYNININFIKTMGMKSNIVITRR